LDLIDKKNSGCHTLTFIHSDLAIWLTQWISLIFALQVSYWIRTLFTQGRVELNLKVIKEKENLINDYKKRIEYLEKDTLNIHSRNIFFYFFNSLTNIFLHCSFCFYLYTYILFIHICL
jgi:hypothetical protein